MFYVVGKLNVDVYIVLVGMVYFVVWGLIGVMVFVLSVVLV